VEVPCLGAFRASPGCRKHATPPLPELAQIATHFHKTQISGRFRVHITHNSSYPLATPRKPSHPRPPAEPRRLTPSPHFKGALTRPQLQSKSLKKIPVPWKDSTVPCSCFDLQTFNFFFSFYVSVLSIPTSSLL
jgi:hypothetical protein